LPATHSLALVRIGSSRRSDPVPPDQARTLGAPFTDERAAAARLAASTPWPSAGKEFWRYSRIGQLDLERFPVGSVETQVEAGEARGYLATSEEAVGPPGRRRRVA
jgi:hypothetical protein